MLRLTALTITALTALFAFVTVAEAGLYDIKKVLRDDIQRVAPDTDIPIRLPARMSLDYDKNVFGDGFAGDESYEFDVDAVADCGGNACFLAQFQGERGGTPAFKRTVSLAKGITGYYKPLSCGGSCSPPMIQWLQRGVLYSIQAKLAAAGKAKQRRAMVRAANSAIRATPR